MPKNLCVRTLIDSQHVKGFETLHFIQIKKDFMIFFSAFPEST